MAFNQFTNLDFNDLKAQIKDYLRANSNFSDFDFDGSNFSVLIDTLAYNSYITSYNTNMAVNEAFIDSATLRENVVSLARNIGYVPRSKKSSTAKINFSVNVSSSKANVLTLHKGLVASGNLSNGDYLFSIPDDITARANDNDIVNFSDITVHEGTLLTKTFTVDNSQVDAKYILPNANIDTSTIRVTITNPSGTEEVFNKYENIYQVNSLSRLFLVQEISDERYQLLFGDGTLGKKPENGSTIKVTYIVTQGELGNGAANFSFNGKVTYAIGGINQSVTQGVSLISTTQPSENGASIESVDSIKYLAPRVYASQQRAVTANDYISLIPNLFSNIDSVSAYGGEEVTPPEYGKVYITIKPQNGEYLSDVSKEAIRSRLKQYTVAGIKQEFVDLKYLYVEYNSTVSYDPGSTESKEGLSSSITNAVSNYAKSSDINQFGGRLKYSKLLNIIDTVSTSVTSNITVLKMRRNLIPAYNKLANYELCYGNRFHKDMEGFNIRSSSFKLEGVEGSVYLSDLPDETGDTGTIRYFTIVDEKPNYINLNAGVVDYAKGEIILYPTNISSTGLTDKVEIEVIPESNDIIAKQNLYIVLDTTANSKLHLLEDIVTSGLNRSGNEYIPPSSFVSTKNYIR